MSTSSPFSAVSLFTGVGGMDVGFEDAGIEVIWANELSATAAETFEANHPGTPMLVGDIKEKLADLPSDGADIVFGGPPCQGFSVAGKMDPDDPRSQLIFSFLDVVERCRPAAFVMENVKALGALGKWSEVREKYLERVHDLGYTCHPFICRATDFGVPQKRERVFFIGVRDDLLGGLDFEDVFAANLEKQKYAAPTVKQALSDLGRAGTTVNPATCPAKIVIMKEPILRNTPWAGMLYNGAGRPVDLDGYSNTLLASMGGSGTPIIDENYLYGSSSEDWHIGFFNDLKKGVRPDRSEPPSFVRRITTAEAARIQTFPDDYIWKGKNSAVYKQIGNAVPPKLAQAIAAALLDTLDHFGITPR